MKQSFLSKFTPSLLPPETLEALFVQRQALAAKLVDGIRESAESDSKHYYLLIGPRGIGKTHLVSLVYHRVAENPVLGDKLLIAWLLEEPWGIASFRDFLLSVLRALLETSDQTDLAARYKAIFDLEPDKAELAAERLLAETVGEKTLLVITENLDETFKGLERNGQQKLRAYIQNHPFFAIVATSQSLFSGVSTQASPFYGFFETHHLRELSLDEAISFLAKMATEEEDEELASFIYTAKGRARIRAVHHLAAGNPRVYVIFAQFLTRKSLDQLVRPLMQTLDDLTPYYQARMNYLSPQQRKIVEFLCNKRRAVSVAEIAQKNFMTHQSTSSQLKKLRELGYAQGHSVGRESYYELREPLMRISLEVKKLRGEPIRLLVEFLQLWYSRTELTKKLEALSPDADCDRQYLATALQACEPESEDPRIAACLREFARHEEAEDFETALRVAEELIEIRGSPLDWYDKSECLRKLSRADEADQFLTKALAVEPTDAERWSDRGYVLLRVRQLEGALASLEKALTLDPELRAAWRNQGCALATLGRYEDALASFQMAVQLNPTCSETWNAQGATLGKLGLHVDALSSLDQALELDAGNAAAWHNRATALFFLGRHDEAWTSYERAADIDGYDARTWRNQALRLQDLGQWAQALASLEKAHELDPSDTSYWGNRASILYGSGRLNESLTLVDQAVERKAQHAESWSMRGVVLSALGRQEEALASFDEAIKLLTACQDPESLLFRERCNRTVALMLMGRWEEGSRALDKVLRRLAEADDDVEHSFIVRHMLIRTQDAATWRRHITVWIELSKKHRLLDLLASGVASSILALSIPWITDEAACAWRDVWQELGSAHKEMALPLRLLNAAVEYRAKPDKRVLLRLPIEERKILEPLLGALKSDRTT